MTREELREEWERRIADFKAGGMTRVQWCKEHDENQLWDGLRNINYAGGRPFVVSLECMVNCVFFCEKVFSSMVARRISWMFVWRKGVFVFSVVGE